MYLICKPHFEIESHFALLQRDLLAAQMKRGHQSGDLDVLRTAGGQTRLNVCHFYQEAAHDARR